MFNAKELKINKEYMKVETLAKFSDWTNFYSLSPLMSDIPEDIQDYVKPFIVIETTNHLISNCGIVYYKNSDVMFFNGFIYRDQYSRLILGYSLDLITSCNYASSLSYQQFCISDLDDQMIILFNPFTYNLNFTEFSDSTIDTDNIQYYKPIIIYKNSKTLMTDKTEELQPHELQYSLANVDRWTEFKYDDVVMDFSNISSSICQRFDMSISDITTEVLSFVKSIYASNEQFTSSISGIFPSDINKLMYTMTLYYEYIYNYKLNKQIDEVNLLNDFVDSSFSVVSDLIKILLPTAYYQNCNNIGEIDKILGIACYTKMITYPAFCISSDIFEKSIKLDEIVCTSWISDFTLYNLSISISDLKNIFYEIQPDFSTTEIDDIISSIDNWDEFKTATSQLPIILLNESKYELYNNINSAGIIYLLTSIQFNITKTFEQQCEDNILDYEPLLNFNTNVILLTKDLLSNDTTSYLQYTSKLNIRFGVINLTSDVFNPSLIRDINNTIDYVEKYDAKSKLRTWFDSTYQFNSNDLIRLQIDETTENDSTIFIIPESNSIIYMPFSNEDMHIIRYKSDVPQLIYTVECFDTISTDDYRNIKFNNWTGNVLRYVPVNVETDNILRVGYEGLLLLKSISEGDNIELLDVYIKRDITSNDYRCKLKLNKYDMVTGSRYISYEMIDGNLITNACTILYEFGLGFELMASDNINDQELIKILYYLYNMNNQNKALLISKLLQAPKKLKLQFRKLTKDPVLLRSIVGDKDSGTILLSEDSII